MYLISNPLVNVLINPQLHLHHYAVISFSSPFFLVVTKFLDIKFTISSSGIFNLLLIFAYSILRFFSWNLLIVI